jgi:hypothetical protein
MDSHLWLSLLDACFGQVADNLSLRRRETRSASASAVRGKTKKVDAEQEQPELLYV